MAEKLASLRKKGGKKVSPIYFYYRGAYTAQGSLPNDLIKQYKYIRVYNTAVVTVPNPPELVSWCDAYINMATTATSIATTDVDISTLNLTNGGESAFVFFGDPSLWYTILIGLHD